MKYFCRYSLFGAILVFLISGAIYFSNESVVRAQSSSNWPQVQHDWQRSGRATNALIPPFAVKWKWLDGKKWGQAGSAGWQDGTIPKTIENEIPVLSQPISGDGKVYVGSYNGKLYAIDESTGDTRWEYQTGLSILHTAGYADKKVYVGSLDSYFYALDSSNGILLWKYKTGPIYSAPLVLTDRVCIGSKTGYYYCFHLNDSNGDQIGDLIFRYEAGAPIYHSSAASPDGLKIYFGSEDMYPNCLTLSGQKCSGWNPQKIPGQSFIHYWPVATADKVIFTTLPIYPSTWGTNGLFEQVEKLFDSTSQTAWSAIEPMLTNYFQSQPFQQTFFVLNATTGQKTYETAIAHTAYHMDTRMPPALGPNNQAYILYRSKDSSLRIGSFGTKYPLEIGELNLATGQVSSFGPVGSLNGLISHCLDDPSIFSSAGGVIYGGHSRRCVAALDTVNRTEFLVVKSVRNLGSNVCGGESPFFFDINSDYPDVRGYNNRGEGLMPPVIAGDSLYMVFRGGLVIAVKGKIR